MKRSLIIIVILIILAVIGYGYARQSPKTSIEYRNTQYGFSITLPLSWKGYTVSIDTWTGYEINDQLGDVPKTTGPLISIHNPKWTKEHMYQDIPIMIFTFVQWDLVTQEKLSLGAAPIGPSELGRNANYVFALPARYNYAFPEGFEEVEEILATQPFHAF